MDAAKEEIQKTVDATIDVMTEMALRLIDEGMPPKEALKRAAVAAKEVVEKNG